MARNSSSLGPRPLSELTESWSSPSPFAPTTATVVLPPPAVCDHKHITHQSTHSSYLRQRGYDFTSVGLSVSRITRNVVDDFGEIFGGWDVRLAIYD